MWTAIISGIVAIVGGVVSAVGANAQTKKLTSVEKEALKTQRVMDNNRSFESSLNIIGKSGSNGTGAIAIFAGVVLLVIFFIILSKKSKK